MYTQTDDTFDNYTFSGLDYGKLLIRSQVIVWTNFDPLRIGNLERHLSEIRIEAQKL